MYAKSLSRAAPVRLMARESKMANQDAKNQDKPGGKGAAKPDPVRSFLVALATDPARLGAFIKDADAEMKTAGLSAEDQAVLKSGNPGLIHARLAGVTQQPPVTVLVVDSTGGDNGDQELKVRPTGRLGDDPPPPPQVVYPQMQMVYPPPPPPQVVYPQMQMVAPPQVVAPPMMILVIAAETAAKYGAPQPQIVPPLQIPPLQIPPLQTVPLYGLPPLQLVPQLIAPPMVVDHLRGQQRPVADPPPVIYPQVAPPPQIVYPQITPPPQMVISPQMVIAPPMILIIAAETPKLGDPPPPVIYPQIAPPPQIVYPQITPPPQMVISPQMVIAPPMILIIAADTPKLGDPTPPPPAPPAPPPPPPPPPPPQVVYPPPPPQIVYPQIAPPPPPQIVYPQIAPQMVIAPPMMILVIAAQR
jgi:hypothetical protein